MISSEFVGVCVIGQVTNIRTMAHECNIHMVGVTADKNNTWHLEQRVK